MPTKSKTWPRTNSSDLARKRFGRLRVIGETEGRAANGAIVWRCECRCGNKDVMVMTHNLNSGNTQSCGCYQGDQTRRRCKGKPKASWSARTD